MAEAYLVPRTFEPSPPTRFCVPRHYLVYAASGRLRLSFERQTWTLPPTRAALIAAETPVEIERPTRVVASSALFDPATTPPPIQPLSVFEVTPLVRHLLLACRRYTSPDESLDEEGRALFVALRVVVWRLARCPSPAVMPQGRTREVVAVARIAESEVACPPSFAAVAAKVGMSPRALSRRLSLELGLSWRELIQRARMIRAIERLVDDPDASVTKIATDIGYSSPSAFNAAFRAFSGTTPTAWRLSAGLDVSPRDVVDEQQ